MTPNAAETTPTQAPPVDGVLELTGNPARDLARSFNVRFIAFLALHVPLVFLLEAFPVVGTVYGLLVLAYGIRAGMLSKSSQVLYALAYIAGAEVLWRMTGARLPWEYAKYASVVIVAVAIVMEWSKQHNERQLRSAWPLFLLLALIPGAAITLLQGDLGAARDDLSFNLGGYLALAMMALYVWGRAIDTHTAVRLLLALIAPIMSIVTFAAFSTLTLNTEFLLASNSATSGNYGPNQVSDVLGIAALACVMLMVLLPRARGARFVLILLTFVFLGQAMLTFSRGGVYSFVLGLAAFGLHTLRTSRSRGSFFIMIILGTVLLVGVVFPLLNNYTGGALALRLAELDSTGRVEAGEADLRAFAENPVTGVGVGLATTFREGITSSSLAAHTEYTRLLGEHGLFGLAVILILLWMMLKQYLANPQGLGRGFVAGFAVWGLSVMVHSAMRIEVIPFALAMALIIWRVEQVEEPSTEPAPAKRLPDTRALTAGG